MTSLLTLEDLGLDRLAGVRVLVRVDFNVPLAEGRVLDATRIEEALPTLRDLRAAGARILVVSHCGRPKGKPDPSASLRPVAAELERLLGVPVAFATDCVGEAAEEAARRLEPGAVCLLENLRFHPGETAADPAFADALAALAEVYVGDAFGAAHRAHASVVGVPERLRRKAAGRLLVREVEVLGKLLGHAERPFGAVLGGAKVEGKIDTLENLLPHLDALIIGGGMANTFLAAEGRELGRSLVEPGRLQLAREILARAAGQGIEVLLPEGLVVTDDLANPTTITSVDADGVPAELMAVDIGEGTRWRFGEEVAKLATVFWNGPLGVFEKPPFDAGTRAMAVAVGKCPGFTVIGGGETVAAARQAGVLGTIDHVSTGGGASLELLAGKKLPGVVALRRPGAEG